MTHLLAMSIGPVQEFIAAGRRTNDLFAGSKIISEVTRAAALAIDGELVFPAPNVLGNPGAGIANKILAVVSDPKVCVDKAKKAAKGYMSALWDEVIMSKLGHQRQFIESKRADPQVHSFLEFYSAWVLWDGSDLAYQHARESVELLLAGRKAMRDFRQPQKYNVPKSMLDPTRDSVVINPKLCSTPPLRLKVNEWLDAVSVTKRVLGAALKVPSTADLAARTLEAWLESGSALEIEMLQLLRRFGRPGFLGHLVFENSRKEVLKEESDSTDATSIEAAHNAFREANFRIPESDPYFAILVADGDSIGKTISGLPSKSAHQNFSQRLAEFSQNAVETIDAYRGHRVYSGGDDVLAFLPVHTAVQCAAALAKQFAETVNGGSLSVGIAIVHYHEPLYITLELARDAEKLAKNKDAPDRTDRGNRIAVVWHTRGGQPRAADSQWPDDHKLRDWDGWMEAYRNGLPRGFGRELDRLARETADAGLPTQVLRDEADRIYKRKEWDAKHEALKMWDVARDQITNPCDLKKLAELLILLGTMSGMPQGEEDAQ